MVNSANDRIVEKEAHFHDEWAISEKVEDIDIEACFNGSTALEFQYINSHIGNISGKKLLDIGAGLGESSVYFAHRGATVITCDLSFDMVWFSGRRRVRKVPV